MSCKFKIGINGFGRIGRCLLRAYVESEKSDAVDSLDFSDVEIVAINAAGMSAPEAAHAYKYDSVHGRACCGVSLVRGGFDAGCGAMRCYDSRDVLPWGEIGVDIVCECTGQFNTRELSLRHVENGAKFVVVSAPCKDADVDIVLGVNSLHNYKFDDIKIISVGSCTTNCFVPIAKILHECIGIKHGFMTTIHAYTNDQELLDSRHQDPYRSRAAALSMVPTSTGAAKMIGIMIPELAGKIDGAAVRVPVPNVSMIDFTFESCRNTSVDEINDAVKVASCIDGIGDVVAVSTEPLVSSDFNHTTHSAIFDITQTKVVDGSCCRIVAWYDNEYGFANRMLDICQSVARLCMK